MLQARKEDARRSGARYPGDGAAESDAWRPLATHIAVLCVLGLSATIVSCSGEIGGLAEPAHHDANTPNGLGGSPHQAGTGHAPPSGSAAAAGGAGDAAGDGAGGPVGDGTGAGADGEEVPADTSLHHDFTRLTRAEYHATVVDALGVEPDVNLIPEDGRIGPFTSNATVTPDPVHPYLLVAESLAAALIPSELPACEAGAVDSCVEQAYREPLSRLFRRPIGDRELATLVDVVRQVEAAGGTASSATRAMLGAALVSPDFLYRASPSRGGVNATARKVSERLSYALWDAPPDAALRAAVGVAEVDLDGVANGLLREQALRLLADARATMVLSRFLGQWLDVDIDRRRVDEPAFETSPEFLELLSFVEYAVASNLPVTVLIGGTLGFVHRDNADAYGLDALPEGADDVVQLHWAADDPRRGLLGMELMAGSTRHPDPGRRPIFRGLLVRRALLCDPIPSPDPELIALAGEVGDRTADARCATCHQRMDPIGRAFAALDADLDSGPQRAIVNAHAELEGDYPNVAALLEAVSGSRAFAECFARHWLGFFLEQALADVPGGWVSLLADSVQSGASLGAILGETVDELHARSEAAVPWCDGE